MLHTIAFKGPLGLFACALIASFAAHAQEALEGRPAAIAVNSATVQGQQSVDPIQRTWRERITPVAIHYPGIDAASGAFQDKAQANPTAFNKWLAQRWIDHNASCNRILQQDFRSWEGPAPAIASQCMELNRPLADLVSSCDTPVLAKETAQTWKITWSCRLAPTGLAWFFPATGLTSADRVNVDAANPSSGAPVSIPISIEAIALPAAQ